MSGEKNPYYAKYIPPLSSAMEHNSPPNTQNSLGQMPNRAEPGNKMEIRATIPATASSSRVSLLNVN